MDTKQFNEKVGYTPLELNGYFDYSKEVKVARSKDGKMNNN